MPTPDRLLLPHASTIRNAAAASSLLLALIACSGGDTEGTVDPVNEETTAEELADEPSPTEEESEEASEPLTAGDLTAILSCADLPTGERVVHTAESDPNELLGRPNGYIARSDLADTRISDTTNGIDDGVVVEQFEEEAEAQERADYIEEIIDAMGGLAGNEYDTVLGPFLLRVAGELTPDQAQAYQDALSDLPEGGPIEPCEPSGDTQADDGAVKLDEHDPRAYTSLKVVGTTDGLPTADGAVEIVATGPPSGGSIPVLVHNGTDGPVTRVEVSGRVVDGDGETVGTGSSQGFAPNLVPAGGYAVGYLYAGTSALPDDATLDSPSVDFTEGIGEFENRVTIEVNDVEQIGSGNITGEMNNPLDETATGPLSITVGCFSADGALLAVADGFADRDELQPGDSSTFTLDSFTVKDATCDTMLASATSFIDY